MTKKIFLLLFIIALLIQATLWRGRPFVDKSVWTNEAQYFDQHDPRVFDPQSGYGYPGTTLIVPAAIAHRLFHVSYENAVAGVIAIEIAGAATLLSVLCYALLPTTTWWLATFALVILHPLYLDATPPSAIVTPLISALLLITWLIWQRPTWQRIATWSVVAGFAAATRLDISVAIAGACAIFLLISIGWRKTLLPTIGAGAVFVICNPFMWFMPVRHLTDILQKIIFHYTDRKSAPQTLLSLFKAAPFGVIGFLVTPFVLRLQPIPRPFPPRLVSWLWLISLGLTIFFMHSAYQPIWYFFPLTLFWELMLAGYLILFLPAVSWFLIGVMLLGHFFLLFLDFYLM